MKFPKTIKGAARKTPGLGPLASGLVRRFKSKGFTSSEDYWLERYRKAGNSGSGSYGRLAEFKADFLNAFVQSNNVSEIVELGCGDGAQLKLAKYPFYTGVDISPDVIARCRAKFVNCPNYRFAPITELEQLRKNYDLSLSLDVIFHLVEDNVFRQYMDQLLGLSSRFAIIYSSNFEGRIASKHVRHHHFTDYVSRGHPNWRLLQHQKNPYPYDERDPDNTSFADFYVFEKSI